MIDEDTKQMIEICNRFYSIGSMIDFSEQLIKENSDLEFEQDKSESLV